MLLKNQVYTTLSRQNLIVYSTTTGSTHRAAVRLQDYLWKNNHLMFTIKRNVTPEDLVQYKRVIFLISTGTGGTPVPDFEMFFNLLNDLGNDFRVSSDHFNFKFSVIGFGCDEYPTDAFCTPAKITDRLLSNKGGKRATPLLCITDTKTLDPQLNRVFDLVSRGLERPDPVPSETVASPTTAVTDADDIEDDSSCATVDKKMVTEKQREQLTKEGYKIIGSHSAVKLCRWTKHHIRGRGGCYKHTFYGISSAQCMEATPSLACANKCVFCWRHHKNPVGTEWRWETDSPEMIVNEAISLHLQMIKQLKGVPGVTEHKFQMAQQVRHCALSLVGEPIMYPEINTLLELLHDQHISTFLVTNAQFPEAVRSLRPVTQLYVSIDASNQADLKAVDRPLFTDFWDRYIDSLKALKHKKQRTVYRLTLVKEYNMSEVSGYVDLVKYGKPSFIEIKAVTYSGDSSGTSDLSMKNVPWHEEVKKFGIALCEQLSDAYEIACEHKHSCSILLALKTFKVDGIWHTWIDYEKFNQLAKSGRSDFSYTEYWAPTPDWAVYGAEEQGFDPEEVRVYRNKQGQKEAEGDAVQL
jgi:tRNA wybutosine-synthesizing protein 1